MALEYSQTTVITNEKKVHILHVEDDPVYAKLILQVLERYGYEVTQAEEGASGRLAFNEDPNKWAAVLVDLHLPHVTGDVLVKEMHQIRPDLPIIVLTGELPDTALSAYEKGAIIVWHKPISLTDLVENLKAVINIK